MVEGQRYAWGTITGPITIPELMAAGVVLLAAFEIGLLGRLTDDESEPSLHDVEDLIAAS